MQFAGMIFAVAMIKASNEKKRSMMLMLMRHALVMPKKCGCKRQAISQNFQNF